MGGSIAATASISPKPFPTAIAEGVALGLIMSASGGALFCSDSDNPLIQFSDSSDHLIIMAVRLLEARSLRGLPLSKHLPILVIHAVQNMPSVFVLRRSQADG